MEDLPGLSDRFYEACEARDAHLENVRASLEGIASAITAAKKDLSDLDARAGTASVDAFVVGIEIRELQRRLRDLVRAEKIFSKHLRDLEESF